MYLPVLLPHQEGKGYEVPLAPPYRDMAMIKTINEVPESNAVEIK